MDNGTHRQRNEGEHQMNAAHTATPWAEQEMPGNDRITTDDGENTTICEFPYGLDANATFIVRACNSHDALVTALRGQCNAFELLYSMATKQTKHNFALEMAERGMTSHDMNSRAALAAVGEGA